MKKKFLLILILAVASFSTIAQNADDQTKYVPSNWGGWKNLSLGTTDITYYTKTQLPMDVQVSGQTVHVAWTDWKPNADGDYCLWYRRSTDAGRTWEEPRAIVKSKTMKMGDINYVGGNFGSNSKWMEVEGQNVHFVTVLSAENNENAEVYYTYSHDSGKTFQMRKIADGSEGDGHYWYGRPHVEADGQTLVIAFQGSRYNGTNYKTRMLTSFDGGTTFTDKTIDTTQELVDLQVSGRQWAVLGNDMYWYYNMHWGNVYISTSSDGGETITTQNVAPLVREDTSWCQLTYMKGFNGASFNYHAQMTLEGDVINVIFQGCAEDQGDPHPTNDRNHTIFRRSTDFGKTWTKAMYLPESKDTYCAIAAKGQNIYVLSTPNGPRMYHSHDGGQTWETQPRCFWNSQYSGFANFFDLYLAPDDPTGQHVYLTTCRGLLVESKDGFRTVHRNFAVGYESWDSKDRNNHSLTVRLDSEGTEHWVMNYSAPYKAFDPYFWSIVYRRNDPAPATSGQEMALDISVPENRILNTPLNKVTIPMTPSIMETREAMTVECWVRIDKRSSGSLDIAALSHYNGNHNGSPYNGGWYIKVHQDGNQGYTFYGGVSTELSVNGVGKELSDRWRYRTTETGMWHHVALTYDSHVEKDNIRLYVDGMLINTGTEKGTIIMGNNPIVIGPSDASDYYVNQTYVDNFAVFSRALTEEEIRQHIYNLPDAKDKDCRLLLTFDGSLQDQSQYHNDPAPLLENYLKAHDGIRPPHPEFSLTKDLMGQTIYMTDMTQDGEAYQWIKPDPWNLERLDKYSTSKQRHDKQDVSGHPGLYTYWMVAKGDGKTTNAYVGTSQSIIVGGLSKVSPESSGNVPDVKLRIQGGYTLTYSKKPRVALKQGTTEIEGTWEVEYGYDSSKAHSFNDLAPANFNLWGAPTGKYDVIVGNDTLPQAFTVEQYEDPDVWMQIGGPAKQLFNKYQRFSIDYGNRSNVPAYNTPIFIAIPDRKGTIDVQFEFEYDLYSDAFGEEELKMAKQLGEYLMAYDEQTGDSVRIYSFFIPYIAPNSTNQRFFRIKGNTASGLDSNIRIRYMMSEPWGPWTDDEEAKVAARRAKDEVSSYVDGINMARRKAECAMTMLGMSFLETGLTVVPVVGCAYNVVKTVTQKIWGKDKSWSNFGTNFITSAFACGSDLFPPSLLVKGGLAMAKLIWDLVSNKAAYDACLRGDPNWKDNLLVYSYDPNEMIGPWGYDDQRHYIKPIHDMAYTITFENKASATAPANEVFVTDTLDLSKYDAETFSFTSYGWADTALIVGGSYVKEFTRNVQYKVNGHDIIVRVSGQFNPETGIANWAFASLEKNGNELEDIMNGFLLPNNDNGVGEGFVSFSIEHKKNPANGSTVSNKATIVFDANEPIVTNTYVNTFDKDYPTSKVTGVKESDGNLIITIQGSDATSGISHYTIYAFKNGGEQAELLVSNVTTTQVTVPCEPGTHYALCATATDNVGWNEPKDLKTEMEITTSGEAPGSNEKTTDVNVSAEGYATFYDSQDNYKLPSGLSAYVVTEAGSTLKSQAINGNIIPKGVPVYLSAREKKTNTYTLTATEDDASYNGSNLLHGSDAATMTTAQEDCLFYKLAYGPSDTPLQNLFGWFWGAPYGAAFHIDAHRAWLAVPKTRATRGYLIGGDGTGIDIPVEDGEDMEVQLYDMQGRPVSNTPKKGLYIRNNKKIFIK